QFVNRYTSGNPAEGYDLHEAASMFDRVRGDLTPEEMRQALQATLANMTPAQRAEMATLLGGAHGASEGGAPAMGLRAGSPPGKGGASVGSLEDLLGGMIGGAAGSQTSAHGRGQAAESFGGLLGGGGSGGDLGGLLGALLGSGAPAGQGGGSDVLGGLLGALGGGQPAAQTAQPNPMSDMLKMVLGGIAAYAMKQMLEQQR
ncbi:MAG: hypothetical protein IT337_06520, partial [Thermomicrobiales bacterium]|nr:hypothetical protein [Thermomicrobiales bacterium]